MNEDASFPLDGDRLFQALSRGEPKAVEEVCRRYGPKVARIVRGYLGPVLRARLETADMTQEAMMEILRGVKKFHFESEKDFLSWLRVMVEHRVLTSARYWGAGKRQGRDEALPAEGLPLADPHAERPSQIFRRREEADRIAQALEKISGPDRDVLLSRLGLGLPWSAVAVSLGTTEAAAQMRFIRARRRLAELLGESE